MSSGGAEVFQQVASSIGGIAQKFSHHQGGGQEMSSNDLRDTVDLLIAVSEDWSHAVQLAHCARQELDLSNILSFLTLEEAEQNAAVKELQQGAASGLHQCRFLLKTGRRGEPTPIDMVWAIRLTNSFLWAVSMAVDYCCRAKSCEKELYCVLGRIIVVAETAALPLVARHAKALVAILKAPALRKSVGSDAHQWKLLAIHSLVLSGAAKDTFRIPPYAHDVIDVPNTVGAVLTGTLAARETGVGGVDCLHSAALGPLISSNLEGSTGGSFIDICRHIFNSDVRAAAMCSPSKFSTSQVQPNTSCHVVLRDAMCRTLQFVCNYVYTAVERYPQNMMSFYAILPLLSDLVALMDCVGNGGGCGGDGGGEEGGEDGSDEGVGGGKHDGGIQRVPIPATTAKALQNGVDLNSIECMLRVMIGNALSKVYGEMERIVAGAVEGYCKNGTGATLHPGEEPDAKHGSGSLLTILCSVMQPLIAVGTLLPPAPSIAAAGPPQPRGEACNELFDALLERALELSMTLLSGAEETHSSGPRQCRQDVVILHRFFEKHPWLGEKSKKKILSHALWNR